MKKRVLITIFLLVLLAFFVSAETYEASDSDLTSGYTKELSSGERITFTLGIEEYDLEANAIYQSMVKIKVSQNDPTFLGLSGNANPQEAKFELDFDNFYDLDVKINSITPESNDSLLASLTLKKIHEEIPANTNLPYSCYKAYKCTNGEKIKQCWEITEDDYTTDCRCKGVLSSDCETQKQEQECEWQCGAWSDCVNSTKTRTCTNPNNCTKEKPKESEACENQKSNEKQRLKFENKTGEACLDDCTCQGVVMRCDLETGREMTVYSSSGNTIVQIKGINMTTNVTLYKENEKIKGDFSGDRTKEIILPDKVEEKIKEEIKSTPENLEVELTNEGFYEVQGKKKAKLFFLFSVSEKINAELNAETGQIININSPWWGFLSKDKKEA